MVDPPNQNKSTIIGDVFASDMSERQFVGFVGFVEFIGFMGFVGLNQF